MLQKDFPYAFIYKVKNFEKHKNNLLNLIFELPENKIETNGCSVSHSDYFSEQKSKKEYVKYFQENIIKDFAKFICEKFNCKFVNFHQVWFQVYNYGDYHKKHRHPNCNLASIFYLELPHKKLITDFGEYKVEIEEGDILTFPAFIEHSSPRNKTNLRKTIISTNSSLLND